MRNVSGYYAESPDSTWIRQRFFLRFFFVLPPWGDHFWGIDREDASSEAFLSTSELRWKGWSPWRFLRASTETKNHCTCMFFQQNGNVGNVYGCMMLLTFPTSAFWDDEPEQPYWSWRDTVLASVPSHKKMCFHVFDHQWRQLEI